MTKIKTIAVLIGLFITLSITPVFCFTAKTTSYAAAEGDGKYGCGGDLLKEGMIAADLRYYPLHSFILINNIKYLVADCGSAIKGRYHFDIFCSSLRKMRARGTIMAECQVLPIKTPKIASYSTKKQQISRVSLNSSCLKSKNVAYSSKQHIIFKPKDELVCMEF